jgi:hypothetical protein
MLRNKWRRLRLVEDIPAEICEAAYYKDKDWVVEWAGITEDERTVLIDFQDVSHLWQIECGHWECFKTIVRPHKL